MTEMTALPHIDITRPVQVYRNLNKPGCQFSVRQGGRVRCYVDSIVLRDARFKHATPKQLGNKTRGNKWTAEEKTRAANGTRELLRLRVWIKNGGRNQPIVTAEVARPRHENLADCFDLHDLNMSSAAYYLGRRTISVDAFCGRLVNAWPMLPDGVRDYIQRIVEAEFSREARLKLLNRDFSPLGEDCDRESWCKVRACWTTGPTAHQ